MNTYLLYFIWFCFELKNNYCYHNILYSCWFIIKKVNIIKAAVDYCLKLGLEVSIYHIVLTTDHNIIFSNHFKYHYDIIDLKVDPHRHYFTFPIYMNVTKTKTKTNLTMYIIGWKDTYLMGGIKLSRHAIGDFVIIYSHSLIF